MTLRALRTIINKLPTEYDDLPVICTHCGVETDMVWIEASLDFMSGKPHHISIEFVPMEM